MDLRQDEGVLLDAVFAKPKDNAARLAYAAWLDDNASGHDAATRVRMSAQAELIRLEVDLSIRPYPDPRIPPPAPALPEETNRQRQLHALLVRGLGPEIAQILATAPRRISFERGFIKTLDLSATPVTELPSRLHVLGTLDLQQTEISCLPADFYRCGSLFLYCSASFQSLRPLRRAYGDVDCRFTTVEAIHEGLCIDGSFHLPHSVARIHDGLSVGQNFSVSYLMKLAALPRGLRVGQNFAMIGTKITQLPEDLVVVGNIYANESQLTAEAARRIPLMPGLSDTAKVSGLRSAGYSALADQVERSTGRPTDGRS